MVDEQESAQSSSRFTLREMMLVITVAAMALGWYASAQRAELAANRRIARAEKRLAYQEYQASFGQDIEENRPRRTKATPDKKVATDKRTFSQVIFDRVNMTGLQATGSFQKVVFAACSLEEAKLTGTGSSFQFAHFENCNLINAVLTGGGSSFQICSFAGADLTGATLSGGGASFQGADLSTVPKNSLESCVFDTPPSYDKATQFPEGFDPKAQGWRKMP